MHEHEGINACGGSFDPQAVLHGLQGCRASLDVGNTLPKCAFPTRTCKNVSMYARISMSVRIYIYVYICMYINTYSTHINTCHACIDT